MDGGRDEDFNNSSARIFFLSDLKHSHFIYENIVSRTMISSVTNFTVQDLP
jgi:hypothetical protein